MNYKLKETAPVFAYFGETKHYSGIGIISDISSYCPFCSKHTANCHHDHQIIITLNEPVAIGSVLWAYTSNVEIIFNES